MENKEVVAKIDNLESQVQELIYLVARLLKNQNPISSTQSSQASYQANKESSPSNKATLESPNAYPKISRSPKFLH